MEKQKHWPKSDRVKWVEWRLSFNTGNSIETILKGAPSIIIGFAFLIHLLQKERHLYWQTEKTKWDAKLAEQQFQQEINLEAGNQIHEALNNEDRNVIKALNSLRKMTQQINRSSNINSVEITFALGDKRQDTTFRRPKRRITFPDNE